MLVSVHGYIEYINTIHTDIYLYIHIVHNQTLINNEMSISIDNIYKTINLST